MIRSVLSFVLLSFLSPTISAQPRVSPRNLYERLLVITRYTGDGSAENPRRPMYAPPPPAVGQEPSRSGILAWSCIESDDGEFALCEFVAVDRAAFARILADKDRVSGLKVFEKGKARRADIEAEFRKYKARFDLSRFSLEVQ
jgi:hypothetical protein